MSDSKKTKTSFSLGVFLNGASTIINVVLLFVEAGIASRFVTADNNGIFVVLLGFINLFMVFSDLGFKFRNYPTDCGRFRKGSREISQ